MRKACVVVAVLFLCGAASAQAPLPRYDREHPYKSKHAPTMPDVPNEQEITFWTLEPGWHTEIELRNNIKDRDLTVTPTLRTADGSQYPLPTITIAANDLHILDLREVLAASAPQLVDRTGSFGSLFLLYSSPFNHNLYSGSMIHLEGTPIAYHFDGVQLDEVFNQGTREGIWWLPTASAKGLIIISNTGLKSAEVLVEAYGQSGKSTHSAVHIGPRQTQRVSVRDLLTSGGIADTSGGLRITIPPGAESVFAAEIVYDETTGFSALMKTFERSATQKVDNVVLRAPMMALSHPDPALYLPPDTVLQPKIFLRNASHQKLSFTGNVRWRTSDDSGVVDFATTELASDALTVIDVFQMQQDGRIPNDASWATPTISYTGRYGDLVAIVASYEAGGKYGLQTPFNDMVSAAWVGSRWYADPVRNSILTVGNASDQPTRANLTLHYNQGKDKYEYEQSLRPGEQIWLDVSKTIQDHIPDKNGNVIPSEVQFGTYTIRDLDHVIGQTLFEGKLTIDKKYGHASYGCGNCCNPVPGNYLDPFEFTGSFGDWWQNTIWGYNQCTDQTYDITYMGYGWDSTDNSIASLSAGGGLANGVGVGGGVTAFGFLHAPSLAYKCPYRYIEPVSWPVNIKPWPKFQLAYSSYIPVDHIDGPTSCPYNGSSFTKKYLGDGNNRGTYRTTESIWLTPDLQQSTGFFRNTGETRNYGAGSPANGPNLSAADEDGFALDCLLWNDTGTADPSNFTHQESYASHQGQTHFVGAASNPLETTYAPIKWDVTISISTANLQSPTATVTYDLTCYPSHTVKVNGTAVYTYPAPQDAGILYITNCLYFQFDHVVGQMSAIPVTGQ